MLEEGEATDHLLIHCPKVRVLWGLVFSLFWGGLGPYVNSTKESLLGWHGTFVGKKQLKVRKMSYLYIFGHFGRKKIE